MFTGSGNSEGAAVTLTYPLPRRLVVTEVQWKTAEEVATGALRAITAGLG